MWASGSCAPLGSGSGGALLLVVCRSRWLGQQVLFSRLLVSGFPPLGGHAWVVAAPPCANVQSSGDAGTRRASLFTRCKNSLAVGEGWRRFASIRVGARSRRAACSQAEEAHELGQ